MDAYEKFILNCDGSKLKVEFIYAVDNSTLTQSYILRCNVYCTGDNFLLTKDNYSAKLRNKADLRKTVSIFKKVKKKPLRLLRTCNSLDHTRLIYGFD